MIFDYQEAVMAGNVIVYPVLAHADLPSHPDDVKQRIVLGGSAGGTAVSLGATADRDDPAC